MRERVAIVWKREKQGSRESRIAHRVIFAIIIRAVDATLSPRRHSPWHTAFRCIAVGIQTQYYNNSRYNAHTAYVTCAVARPLDNPARGWGGARRYVNGLRGRIRRAPGTSTGFFFSNAEHDKSRTGVFWDAIESFVCLFSYKPLLTATRRLTLKTTRSVKRVNCDAISERAFQMSRAVGG